MRMMIAPLFGACALAVCGCTGTTRFLFPPLTRGLISAVNAQYSSAGVHVQPPVAFSISSAEVPPDQWAAANAAAKAVVHDCNSGEGTRIVAAGLVTSAGEKRPIFAIFMNPPGSHIAPYSGPVPSSAVVLNWYAGFTSGKGKAFCTFGYSPYLPPLPTH